MYLVKTPWWLKAIYPQLVWKIPTEEKIIYLSFDDGPHETATPFVLETLAKYQAKASFFCIGKNIELYPEIYAEVQAQGHAVGNHTQHHANGWKVTDEKYLAEINEAATLIESNLFRPPYGRITKLQIRKIIQTPLTPKGYKIIMWTVLSGDFDINLTPAACASNVIRHASAGSIVVFHDSTKAWERMQYALPLVLAHFTQLGYRFEALPQ